MKRQHLLNRITAGILIPAMVSLSLAGCGKNAETADSSSDDIAVSSDDSESSSQIKLDWGDEEDSEDTDMPDGLPIENARYYIDDDEDGSFDYIVYVDCWENPGVDYSTMTYIRHF